VHLAPKQVSTLFRLPSDPRVVAFQVDDFFVDPDPLAAFARARVFHDLRFDRYGGDMYPGHLTEGPAHPSIFAVASALTGARGAQAETYFHLCPATRRHQQRIHQDGEVVSVIVCLNEQNDGAPGTAFYRHKRTGLVARVEPEVKAAVARTGQAQEILWAELEADRQRTEAWEQVAAVATRYNRAVVFHGALYHQGDNWGEGLDDARLIYTTAMA